jgi:hypothetical protein
MVVDINTFPGDGMPRLKEFPACLASRARKQGLEYRAAWRGGQLSDVLGDAADRPQSQ